MSPVSLTSCSYSNHVFTFSNIVGSENSKEDSLTPTDKVEEDTLGLLANETCFVKFFCNMWLPYDMVGVHDVNLP